ncbi:MAG TPA: hypothetical protein VFV93_14010 [Thermomicrobiales bacterium]|nr:hypothetical protein [Thermomicrobiales bacterium]
MTAGLTAIVTLVLLGLALLIPLDTRNARGVEQQKTAFDIWRRTLEHVPADAPFFLTTATLTVLSLAALVASAWVLVAIARLPR